MCSARWSHALVRQLRLRCSAGEVTVLKAAVTPNPGPHLYCKRLRENGPGIHTRVKLPSLSTGVDRRRKLGQERRIEIPAGEFGPELSGVHARHYGPIASANEVARERRCVPSP